MAKTTSNEVLARRIEQLVLEHIEASRQAAHEALERAFASSTRASQPAPRQASSRKRSDRRHRSRKEVAALGEQLYAAICAHPGESMARFAELLGSTPIALDRPMRRLKQAGRVRSIGARSRMRYFPMADSS